MAKIKPKKRVAKEANEEAIDFERAIGELEQIVARLEGGQLGLDQSLAEYEAGVKRLKRCYQLIENAERKIEWLQAVDQDGQPVVEPFDDQVDSLSEKAQSRGAKRSRPSAAREPPTSGADSNVDSGPGLF